MSPLLLFFKAYIPEHQRRLKNGKVVTVAAYYDKRIKKAAIHAPDHTHDVSHLSDADKAKFSNMHKEQHVAHYYEAHALKRKLSAEEQLRDTLKKNLARHEADGDKKSAAIARKKIAALGLRIGRHKIMLERATKIVEGIGKLKHQLVEGSGELKDDADKAHAHYVGKLGARFSDRPVANKASVFEKQNDSDEPVTVQSATGGKTFKIPAQPHGPLKDKPETFIKAPDGSLDFGEITPEISKVIRRQPGKVRLQVGIESDKEKYGVAHIEAGHKKEIENLGYSVADFVLKATQSPDEIRQGNSGSLIMVKKVAGKDKITKLVFVRLKPSKEGDFYRVETAFIKPVAKASKDYPLLWSASVPHPTDSSYPPPSATASPVKTGSDRSTGTLGQSNDNQSIAQPNKKSSHTFESLGSNHGYTYARPSTIDTPAQGVLNGAREGKKAASKRVSGLRERIRNEPLNGNRLGLRLELLRAQDKLNEYRMAETDAIKGIEKRANQLGLTTIKPKPLHKALGMKPGTMILFFKKAA